MATTDFSNGTVVQPEWLNDVDDMVYNNRISITSRGASPSNTAAQNTTAINAALTDAAATGAAVYIPAASSPFLVDDEFTVPDNVLVIGDGRNSSIRQTVAGRNIFILGNYSWIHGVHLHFSVAGNNLDLTKQNAVYVGARRGWRVTNCYLQLNQTCTGVQTRGGTDYLISGNLIWGGTWAQVAGPDASAADILAYSGVSAGRAVITGNHCLSNNSQGIFWTALGRDQNAIISGNICATMNADMTALAANGGTRRHGILASYQGTFSSKTVVSSNICLNTRWTGIYIQGSGDEVAGRVIVSDNVCELNGYQTGNALSGGIYVTSSGGEVVSNNQVLSFQNTDASAGAINILCPASPGPAGTKISHNLILDSASNGIYGTTFIKDIEIVGNTIKSSALHDIYTTPNSGDASVGGFDIIDNTIFRTNTNAASIRVGTQIGTTRNRVRGNKLRGSDPATLASTNVGILLTNQQGFYDVTDNHIEDFYYGITTQFYVLDDVRHSNQYVIDNNRIKGCVQGIGVSAQTTRATLPVSGNLFENNTTNLGAGATAGTSALFSAFRRSTSLEVYVTALPTRGFWAIGDRAVNLAGVVGQARAWTRVTNGSANVLGTDWINEGNL